MREGCLKWHIICINLKNTWPYLTELRPSIVFSILSWSSSSWFLFCDTFLNNNNDDNINMKKTTKKTTTHWYDNLSLIMYPFSSQNTVYLLWLVQWRITHHHPILTVSSQLVIHLFPVCTPREEGRWNLSIWDSQKYGEKKLTVKRTGFMSYGPVQNITMSTTHYCP